MISGSLFKSFFLQSQGFTSAAGVFFLNYGHPKVVFLQSQGFTSAAGAFFPICGYPKVVSFTKPGFHFRRRRFFFQLATPKSRFDQPQKDAPWKTDAGSISETSYKWNLTPVMPKTVNHGTPETTRNDQGRPETTRSFRNDQGQLSENKYWAFRFRTQLSENNSKIFLPGSESILAAKVYRIDVGVKQQSRSRWPQKRQTSSYTILSNVARLRRKRQQSSERQRPKYAYMR